MPHGDRCDVSVLINVDVPDLERAIAFYANAFGLAVGRRFGAGGVELIGWQVPLFLLRKAAGSIGAGASLRTYDRHWTPVHLDVIVYGIESALSRAVAAGALSSRRSAPKRGARSQYFLIRSAMVCVSSSFSIEATMKLPIVDAPAAR